MKKIIIDPHNCSREEHTELLAYLEANSWDYKEMGSIDEYAEETVTKFLTEDEKNRQARRILNK